jgi:hypothetical protein
VADRAVFQAATIKRTLAMAAGIADHIWTPAEIVRLLD